MKAALRILGIADARDLAKLHRDAYHDPWTETALASSLGNPGAFCIGQEDETRELASFALFQTVGDTAELLMLAVVPRHRRLGLARQLLTKALPHLAARGCARLLLDVAEDNGPAISLYGAMGFAIDGRRKAYYRRPGRPDADALLMSLGLTGLSG